MLKTIRLSETETYKKVLEHRKKCNHWHFGNAVGYGNCLECFGGGLTLFTKNLFEEMRRKNIKIEDFDF
jgi:hypothetical protein